MFDLLTLKTHIIAWKRVLWRIVCEIGEGALALESFKNTHTEKIIKRRRVYRMSRIWGEKFPFTLMYIAMTKSRMQNLWKTGYGVWAGRGVKFQAFPLTCIVDPYNTPHSRITVRVCHL